MLKLTPEQRAAAEAGGKRPYWRFLLSGEQVEWADIVLGRRQVKLSAVSDPVLIRADGTPLYTFTSVVDDLDEGDHPYRPRRGPRHQYRRAARHHGRRSRRGAAPPRFAHLPLLVDEDGGKLSKRTGSLTLRSLRHDGIEPAALAGYLARLGTSEDPVPGCRTSSRRDWTSRNLARAARGSTAGSSLALNRRAAAATCRSRRCATGCRQRRRRRSGRRCAAISIC